MTSLETLYEASGLACTPLCEDHFLLDFQCGHGNALAEWLQSKARAYQEENLCQVWVMHPKNEPERVTGYFTLSSHSVTSDVIMRKDRTVNKGNGNEVAAVGRMPAQLLGKFALDVAKQGSGHGQLLMLGVYSKYLEVAHNSGSKFLIVEAREPQLVSYYQDKYGFMVAAGQRDGVTSLYRATAGIQKDFGEATGS